MSHRSFSVSIYPVAKYAMTNLLFYLSSLFVVGDDNASKISSRDFLGQQSIGIISCASLPISPQNKQEWYVIPHYPSDQESDEDARLGCQWYRWYTLRARPAHIMFFEMQNGPKKASVVRPSPHATNCLKCSQITGSAHCFTLPSATTPKSLLTNQ